MSLQLFMRTGSQRSLALVADTHAIVFRQGVASPQADLVGNGMSDEVSTSRCMVKFSPSGDVDLGDYRALRLAGLHGTLGLVNINREIFLCVITRASRVATIRPDETVQRIVSVEFCRCISNSDDLKYSLTL